jgi:hypothetical protein
MQILKHDPDGPHKLVRIETMGCAVNVLIDLHEENGTSVVAVEVEPSIPDELGRVWEAHGPTAVVVRCLGRQGEEPRVSQEDSEAPLATLHQLVSSNAEPRESVEP